LTYPHFWSQPISGLYSYCQRTGIADGGEIEFRPPEPLPGFLLKINIKN